MPIDTTSAASLREIVFDATVVFFTTRGAFHTGFGANIFLTETSGTGLVYHKTSVALDELSFSSAFHTILALYMICFSLAIFDNLQLPFRQILLLRQIAYRGA